MLAAALGALCLWPGASARADVLLTEADVIRRARVHTPGARVAAATEALAGAEQRGAGLLPDPEVAWDRETGPSGAQDTFRATVPIDVARPLTRRALARSHSEWLRAQAALDRSAAVEQTLRAFYSMALAAERVIVLEQALASLEEAARVLASREAAGTVSGYESTRLAIETELMRSRVIEARGAWRADRARLAALLGLEPDRVQIAARLAPSPADSMPDSSPDAEVGPVAITPATAALDHARRSLRAAGEARDRARWTWLPAIDVSAGVNQVSGGETGTGYVAGLSLTVPIFDRGQHLRAQARAEHDLARARVHATEQNLRADAGEARARYRNAAHELERFDSITAAQLEALLRAAHAGYREGERSLVELLDAQRVDTEVAMRRLELQAQARDAEIRVRAAMGELQ